MDVDAGEAGNTLQEFREMGQRQTGQGELSLGFITGMAGPDTGHFRRDATSRSPFRTWQKAAHLSILSCLCGSQWCRTLAFPGKLLSTLRARL